MNDDRSIVSAGAQAVATVNADNPWPGLLAFREADQEYFEGRRAETGELFRLVMRERLTVLFGLSGLGKSSLLQAGLFPLLRRENILPVYIRLDFSSRDLVAQVTYAIVSQTRAADIEAPARVDAETLWEYFHRQDSEFWTRRNRLVTPLLALDQFEEVFTLGRLDASRAAATDALLTQLADLAEGRPPAALKAWLDEHPNQAGRYSFVRHPYKLLLSIREDFLAELEPLRPRLPAVALNRFRLQHMNGRAALRVVSRARNLIDPPAAEKVVRFVAADRKGLPLDQLEVEPALLSVVCRELNNKRRSLGEARITEHLLEGSHDEVLNDFYERTVGDLPLPVRRFIEERLLTVSGFRDSVALENALSVPGISPEHLDRLVERRLLRREDRGGVQRLELTHDLLTGVIRASRDSRHRREESEKARRALLEQQERERQGLIAQREEEDRQRAKRALKQTRIAAAVFALLTITAVGAMLAADRARRLAEDASAQARTESERAERERKGADEQRRRAEELANRIQQSLLIRQAALSGDDGKLNELLGGLKRNDSIRFGAAARPLGYKSGGLDIYQLALFPRPESLPSGENAVAFVTYLADHPTFHNTLMTAGQKREFRATYTGWGCLRRIVALTEYVDPSKEPTVTVFDMCEQLGPAWSGGP